MNSNNSLLASPRAAGAATATLTSSAFTPYGKKKKKKENRISLDKCSSQKRKGKTCRLLQVKMLPLTHLSLMIFPGKDNLHRKEQ